MWHVETKGSVAVARIVAGPVANVRVPEQTWSQLNELISGRPTGRWLVDVSTERVLTSEALAIIIGLVRHVQNAGGRIAFAGCSPGVTNVLISMRLAKMLPLYADIETGVAALSGAQPASGHEAPAH